MIKNIWKSAKTPKRRWWDETPITGVTGDRCYEKVVELDGIEPTTS
jgi:hypothetical protein